MLRRPYVLEISARACFEAPMHSKSLLELAYFSLEVAEATARACFEAIMGSKSLLKLASKHLCTPNHCSSLIRSISALKITARACLFFARSRRSLCSSFLRSYYGFEITAGVCFEASMHSKSLFEFAYLLLEVTEATTYLSFGIAARKDSSC